MKITNNTIIMDYDDFKALIAEEVSKELSKREPSTSEMNPALIFNDLQEDRFGEINSKHNVSKEVFEIYQYEKIKTKNPSYALSINTFESGTQKGSSRYVSHSNINYTDTYDLIRKLSLATCGVSLNKQLHQDDYRDVRNAFIEIQDKFFELYEKRIKKLNYSGKNYFEGKDNQH